MKHASDALAVNRIPPRRKATSRSGAVQSPLAIGSLDNALWARYEPRMRRVIAHLYDHLDEPLDLNALSDIACLSPYHWHRVYHAMVGETLAQTVKRLRLHRAAGHLAQTTTPIKNIAADAGYPNLQSFTRTFKAVHGMPPARYRAAGQHLAFAVQSATPVPSAFDVAVHTFDTLPVLAVEHRGSYMAIGRAFDLLFGRVAAAGLARPGMRMLALYFDDPGLVPEHALRSQAAVAGFADAGAAPDCGLLSTTIPGGAYAVLAHQGPYASMRAAYQWLFGQWLPHAGCEPASAPVVEEYLNSPRDTAPQDLRTLICLPLICPPLNASPGPLR